MSDDDLAFDQVLDRLRSLVERLEEGRLSLEEQLAVFEEGVGLARRGTQALDRAERRVEELVAQDGRAATVPFESGPAKE